MVTQHHRHITVYNPSAKLLIGMKGGEIMHFDQVNILSNIKFTV